MRHNPLAVALFVVLLAARAQGASAEPAGAEAPSFSCGAVKAGSIEALVCGDAQLVALDRKLARVYAQAVRAASNEDSPVLRAEQRGWIKGRDDCWKATDRRACVDQAYRRRIAELQARFRLVPGSGPVRWRCDDGAEVVVEFFRTEPSTLIAERGGQVSMMFQAVAASGARYQGRNESFWEHQGEARVVWGEGAPGHLCRPGR